MRNLSLTFLFLVASLLFLALFVGVRKVEPRPVLREARPHLYNDESLSIEKIQITVFYFVPKDALSMKDNSWQKGTEEYLKKLQNFHLTQFENTSKISYTFFPEIIEGILTTREYEGLFDGKNNDALIPIKDEIISRVYNEKGELFYSTMQKGRDSKTRNSYMVIFEGKGAAGNDDFALVSRSYVTDDSYKEIGPTFFAHEFYHTLGLVDNYQTSMYAYKNGEQTTISLITSKDIMGQVNVPLTTTYIDSEALRKMGL